MHNNILLIVQIILSLILTVLIIIQSKGMGLGRTLFSGSQFYSTKRGFEKVIFTTTIVVGCLFFLSSIIQLIF